MSATEGRPSGWRGAALVAVTYIHFLIFAQFGFLSRLAALGIAGTHLKAVMGAMAAGGVALSLLAPRRLSGLGPSLRLRIGLGASAAAAVLAMAPLNLAGALAVSLLTGAGLGLLTVTLVTHLRIWTGARNPLMAVAAGTGAGYWVCNLPAPPNRLSNPSRL